MTPTGKADVKERARQFLKKRADVGPLECIWCGVIHSASCDKEIAIVADMVAFAESEAALASKEEREACAKVVCVECRKGDKPERCKPFVWMHTMLGFDDRTEVCYAAAIHERNKE